MVNALEQILKQARQPSFGQDPAADAVSSVAGAKANGANANGAQGPNDPPMSGGDHAESQAAPGLHCLHGHPRASQPLSLTALEVYGDGHIEQPPGGKAAPDAAKARDEHANHRRAEFIAGELHHEHVTLAVPSWHQHTYPWSRDHRIVISGRKAAAL